MWVTGEFASTASLAAGLEALSIDVAADDVTIQLVTRCSSEEEFIERFARFATETNLVVPAQPDVGVGTDGHFAISLKDRSVIMRGRCEVTEILPIAVAPGAPPGTAGTSVRALMRLRLREMDAHSCGIHLRLMERHAASAGPPAALPAATSPRAPAPVSGVAPAEDAATGAVVATAHAPFETEPTELSPAPRPETRAPGAAFTLPANPLGELAAGNLASFIELTLFESNTVADAASGGSGAVVAAGAEAEPGPRGVTPAVARAVLLAARLDRARRIARRVGPYVGCALFGLLLGIALRSASGAASVAEAPAPPPAAAPVVESVPASVPATVTPTIPTDDPQPSAVVAVRSSRRTAKLATGNVRVRNARARHAAAERH